MSELREAFYFLKYTQLQYLRRPVEEACEGEALRTNATAKRSAAISDVEKFKKVLEKNIIPRLLELSYEGNDWNFLSSLCLRALNNLVTFHSSQLLSALDACIFYGHVHSFLQDAEKTLKLESD